MIELLLLIVLGMYCYTQNRGFRKYEIAKTSNQEHKRLHKEQWDATGWRGREWGVPPPPCPTCIQDVEYRG